jgi:hypothetical protein
MAEIFKISLTFRFDKLSNLSKSVHTRENSQILTVSNKKKVYLMAIPRILGFIPLLDLGWISSNRFNITVQSQWNKNFGFFI